MYHIAAQKSDQQQVEELFQKQVYSVKFAEICQIFKIEWSLF
jgi:hypothetical protein